jgi:putative tryptophan/tyrosine transport system substrate-binding protein
MIVPAVIPGQGRNEAPRIPYSSWRHNSSAGTRSGGADGQPDAARRDAHWLRGERCRYTERLTAFRQGLDALGWTEGRDILIDYRFAPASPDQARFFAKELIALRPDALVGNSTPATAALLRETRTIPIVFVGALDPVGSGFVVSIPRPDGNCTGFTISSHPWWVSGSKC